jgi:hypothetical protein
MVRLSAAELGAISGLRNDLAWKAMRQLSASPGNTRMPYSMTVSQARLLIGVATRLLGIPREQRPSEQEEFEQKKFSWNMKLREYVALVAYNPHGECVGLGSGPDSQWPACPAADKCCKRNNNLNGAAYDYDADECFRALWVHMTGEEPPADWMPEREVTP